MQIRRFVVTKTALVARLLFYLDLSHNNLSLRNAVILSENCEKRGEILVIPRRALSNLEPKLLVAVERIIA